MKFKSISAVVLSVLALAGSAAPQKLAFYCGNYTGVFSRAFANVFGKTGDTSNFVINEKADVLVFSHLGKYTGPMPDKEKLLAYAEKGGIVVMFSAVPSIMFSQKRSLESAGELLGANYYEYGKFNGAPTETAKVLLGDTLNGAVDFVAKQKGELSRPGKSDQDGPSARQ